MCWKLTQKVNFRQLKKDEYFQIVLCVVHYLYRFSKSELPQKAEKIREKRTNLYFELFYKKLNKISFTQDILAF